MYMPLVQVLKQSMLHWSLAKQVDAALDRIVTNLNWAVGQVTGRVKTSVNKKRKWKLTFTSACGCRAGAACWRREAHRRHERRRAPAGKRLGENQYEKERKRLLTFTQLLCRRWRGIPQLPRRAGVAVRCSTSRPSSCC